MSTSWAFGLAVFLLVYHSSYAKLLSVDWEKLFKWVGLVILMTTVRFVLLKFLFGVHQALVLTTGMSWLPTWSTLCVPWEDLTHTIPLAILDRVLPPKSYASRFVKALSLTIMMIDFGAGHIYQGLCAAVLLSLYIPITLRIGNKFGFGTIMIGHVVYDFATVLLVKYLI